MFNEASNNVNVTKSKEGNIAVDLHDKNGVEITNKSFSLKKLKESKTTLQYGSFLKSATLLANVGKEEDIEGHTSTNDIEIKPISVLSDEDLFKACNGRTAHKGARHGLNLTGKLQRIAAQEKELLEKMRSKQKKHEVFQEPAIKKYKKNPLAELNSSKDESSDESQLPVDTESDYILKASGKRRKRDRKQELQLATKINEIGLDESEMIDQSSPVENGEDEEPYNGTPVRKKKKSKRASEKLRSIQEDSQVEETPKKNKKKKKGKRKLDEDDDEMPEKMEKQKKPKPETQSKRVKLDESYEASGDEEDVVDKINAEQEALRKIKKLKKSSRKTVNKNANRTANDLADTL